MRWHNSKPETPKRRNKEDLEVSRFPLIMGSGSPDTGCESSLMFQAPSPNEDAGRNFAHRQGASMVDDNYLEYLGNCNKVLDDLAIPLEKAELYGSGGNLLSDNQSLENRLYVHASGGRKRGRAYVRNLK